MSKKPKDAMGPVTFVIGADPEKKIVIFQMNRSINRLEFGPEEALELAAQIMGRAAIAAGRTLEQMVIERQGLPKAPRTTTLLTAAPDETPEGAPV